MAYAYIIGNVRENTIKMIKYLNINCLKYFT